MHFMYSHISFVSFNRNFCKFLCLFYIIISVACNPQQPFSHSRNVGLITALYVFSPYMCVAYTFSIYVCCLLFACVCALYPMVFPGNYRIYFIYNLTQYSALSPYVLDLWALFSTIYSMCGLCPFCLIGTSACFTSWITHVHARSRVFVSLFIFLSL
jgi:hypothetical protein